MSIGDEFQEGLTNVKNLIGENPLVTAAGIGAVALGSGVVVGSVIGSKTKRKTSKRRAHTRRGWMLDRKKFNKSQKWEVNYRKRKKKKHSSKSGKKRGKRIYYAKKTGQPYILKANGQAKFIKGKRRKK